MKKLNKKAQVWSLDAMVAILIFFLGVSILFFYAINFNDQVSSSLNDLFNQGNVAADLLLTDGETGILTNNKINQTRLDDFNLTNYDDNRRELGIKNNFYFLIPNLEANGEAVSFIGKMNQTPSNNLIKIERIVVYKNKPSQFELNIWK